LPGVGGRFVPSGCLLPARASYAYDLAGRPISVTHPDGTTITTSHYAGTNLVQSASGGAHYGHGHRLHPLGKISGLSSGNGVIVASTRTKF
jgi:uncharacterized protein RhaS with RHS repeats